MQATILTSAHAIRTLAEASATSPPPQPFAAWGVLLDWLELPDRDGKPFVIVVKDGADGLLAVAPWMLRRDRSGIRHLSAIGGEDAWYHDPWLLQADAGEAVASALTQALREARRDWDLLSLILRPEFSAPFLQALKPLGFSVENRVEWRQHPVIRFGESWERYWEARPKKIREMLSRRQRQLGQLPHRFYSASPEETPVLLEHLFRHQAANFSGVRDWSAYHAYMHLVAQAALCQGNSSLHVLEIDGRVAATQFQAHHGERAYGLLRSYDAEFGRFSPGSLLSIWGLEEMHRSGMRWIDLGPGTNDWKQLVQTESCETIQIRVSSPGSLLGMGMLGVNEVLLPRLKNSRWGQAMRERLNAMRGKSPLPARP